VANQPEEGKKEEGESHDEPTHGVAESALGESAQKHRKWCAEYAKYEEKHAYRVRAFSPQMTLIYRLDSNYGRVFYGRI
jgi:hypothetical protein